MNLQQVYQVWKNSVLGVGLDIDGAYGKQCVDVVLSYGQAVFPSVHWQVLFPPVPCAKEMFNTYNPTYFDRIVNDHNNPNQLPQPGDIAIFDASPAEGFTSTYANPEGHTGVVDHADSEYIYLVQQDGSDPNTKVSLKQRAWRYTPCLGWLRPKVNVQASPAPSQGDSRIGKTLYVHGVRAKAVVRVGANPIPQNIYNYLLPGNFREGPHGQPGLQYKIIGVSLYPDTVTIRTASFGLVDVYIHPDCEII